jgi:hypothetical protein
MKSGLFTRDSGGAICAGVRNPFRSASVLR